ncbi:lipoprotein [Flavobacterium cheonanense]|uniref:Lipoprotein n=1 Tax=Flavobacterium cheonanense TaxID=706183 RepID=A0ABP7W3N4_9FLAO
MRIVVFALTFIFFSCSNSEQENSLNSLSELSIVASKTFGGSLDEKIGSVVKTSDGGMIVVGHTNSSDGDINKQYDQIDIWIIKIDSQGNKVWSKTIGGSKNDYGTSIIATNDGNFIISGYTESSDGIVPSNFGLHDFLVVKINSSGDVIWSKNYGFSGHDHAHKIIQTSDGGYFVVGFSEYSGIEGSGGTQNNGEGHEIGHKGVLHGSGEFIGVKIDSQGEFMWYRYFGGTQNDRVNDVVEANDGGFLMVGFSESSDFDINDNKGSYDFWVVKLQSNGSLAWKHNYGGSGIDQAFGVVKTNNNSYLIVGRSNSDDKDISVSLGGFDAWVIHIDDHGHLIWNKSFGGSEFDSAEQVRMLSNGNFGIVGNTRSNLNNSLKGENDFWFLEVDNKANSKVYWQKTFGGSNIDIAKDFYQNNNNEIFIVGESQSSDFDVNINRGNNDLWMLKLK